MFDESLDTSRTGFLVYMQPFRDCFLGLKLIHPYNKEDKDSTYDICFIIYQKENKNEIKELLSNKRWNRSIVFFTDEMDEEILSMTDIYSKEKDLDDIIAVITRFHNITYFPELIGIDLYDVLDFFKIRRELKHRYLYLNLERKATDCIDISQSDDVIVCFTGNMNLSLSKVEQLFDVILKRSKNTSVIYTFEMDNEMTDTELIVDVFYN